MPCASPDSGQQAYVEAILDDVEAALADDLLPVAIFNDDAIFKAEMERIYSRNWVFVAHESEIPERGDYVLRRIGLDPVIVVRDSEGIIRVMSNHCRHRGTQVCQTDRGNARTFVCPYHGWAFKNNGEFLAAPSQDVVYGGKLDAEKWGLLRAPHVDSYQGFIFASLDRNAPPLKSYLGGGAWMLDAIVGLHPKGMHVIGAPDRYQVRADWKTAAENFSGDTYHVPHLHNSGMRLGMVLGIEKGMPPTSSHEFEGGHNFACVNFGKINPAMKFWSYPKHYVDQFDLSGFDPAKRLVAEDLQPTVGTIFPNLSVIRHPSTTGPGEKPCTVTSFRQWQPIGPGLIELVSWQFVWSFMTEEEVDHAVAVGQYTFGSSGMFEQDDTVAWEGIARAGASSWLRREDFRFHFQQGRGSPVPQSPDPAWTGPGIMRNTVVGEHRQLAFYRHWLKVMRDNAPNKQARP